MLNEAAETLNETVLSALREKNLDFTAELRPVFYKDDAGLTLPTKMFVPVRADNGTVIADHTFTKVYHPIQNRDAFKVIGEISQVADIEFKNVGSWGNGAGVFAQIALGDDISVGGTDDRVGRYLSVVNSHDGSRGCTILITPYRFWCRNQIAPAIKHADDGQLISIRHNAKAQDRLAELAQTIHVCDKVFRRSADLYDRLLNRKIGMDEVREVMARCLPFEPCEKTGEPSQYWHHLLTKMVDRFHSADNGHAEPMTAWNLYNAVQGTLQHESRNGANKMQSILLGGIASKSAKALRVVEGLTDGTFQFTEHKQFDIYFKEVA